MKLAEALILRADYQKRIEQLKQRLLRNAKVQEGDKPAENPKELTRELEQVSEELEQLIQRINKTNSATELEAGITLSDALAAGDCFINRLSQQFKAFVLRLCVFLQRRGSETLSGCIR